MFSTVCRGKHKCVGQFILFFCKLRVDPIVKVVHNYEYNNAFSDVALFLLRLVNYALTSNIDFATNRSVGSNHFEPA